MRNFKKVNLAWLVIALFSVSSSSIIVRFLPSTSAEVIAFWRMALSSFMLWIYSGVKRQGNLNPSFKKPVIIAGIFLGFHFGLFFSAVKLTTISNATLLGTTAPLFSLIIEIFVLKRQFPVVTIFGVFLAFFGVLVVQDFSIDFYTEESRGNLFAIVCSLCIALVFIIAEKVRQDTSTIIYCRHLFMWAAITLAVISVLGNKSLFCFSGEDFFLFFLLALFPSIFGHVVFNYFIKYFPPSIIISIPLGEPLIASLFALVFFSEEPLTNTLVGGVVTITGLFIMGVKSQEVRFAAEND